MSLLDPIARGPHRFDAAEAIEGPPAVETRRDSIENFFSGLGSTSDKGQAARPRLWAPALNDRELMALYDHNGLARKIVDFWPGMATRKGWTVPELPDEDQRLDVWGRVADAMTWASLFGGAALLLVTTDDVPPDFRGRPVEWLAQPLDLARVQRVDALQVFDALEANPLQYNTDVRSLDYRQPLLWSITADGIRARVHASRVIHFRGAGRPPSQQRGGWSRSTNMPDASYLQAIWDQIRDLTSVMQGGATLAQEMREHVIKIAGLQEKLLGNEAGSLKQRLGFMGMFRGPLGATVIGEGDTYETRANPVTGFAELSSEFKAMLSAVTRIPQMQLFGEAPSGLANDGEGNHESLRQAVSDFQERQRGPLTKLYRAIYSAKNGPTRGKEPEGWFIRFNALSEPSDVQVAELRKKVAETDALYHSIGVYSPRDVAISRFGPDGWSLEMQPVEPPDEDEVLERQLAEALAEEERLAAEVTP
jgi:phage-related protein (TIGR01555 family)